MATPSPFPKYDFSKFEWKLPESGSRRCVREGGGGEHIEDVWNRHCKGDQTLFLAVYVNIKKPVHKSLLVSKAKRTWKWLRFHLPLIAQRTETDEATGGRNTLVVYNIASGEEEVDEWVERTFNVHEQSPIDLDKLRYEKSAEKLPHPSGDQTFLYLVPGPEDADGTVSSFGLLFHSHHTVTDGAGSKVVTNRYLKQLASVLAQPESDADEKLAWGSEAANLLPCIYTIMGPGEVGPLPPSSPEEATLDHPYFSCLTHCVLGAANGMENVYGLKVRPFPAETQDGTDWPQNRRVGVKFTKEESDAVFKKLKPSGALLGEGKRGYTLNQIAHAALTMMTIHDNPPTAETKPNAAVFYNGMADVRERLREPFAETHAYPGYCLAISPMDVPVTAFKTDEGTVAPFDKIMLAKTSRTFREHYTKQRAMPSLLAVGAQLVEILMAPLKDAAAAGIQIPPMYNPWFSADGLGEKYMDVSHDDGNGQPILDVDYWFTTINKLDPGSFFRIKSWKGIIDLSVDFNEKVMPLAVMEDLMAHWKQYMLLVKEFDEDDYA